MINRSIILTLLSAALAIPAVGATDLQINQNYSTGYVNGTALAAGAPDAYFTLYSGGIYGVSIPVVASPIPVAYGPVPAGAQWIAPTEDQADDPPAPIAGSPPGEYGYNENLSTNFLVPTDVTFTGAFESDNAVNLILIGGQAVSFVQASDFTAPTSFSLTLQIAAGQVSTPIDFFVNNVADTNTFNGASANPTGLLVTNLRASAATPEPGTWLLLFAGAGALLLVQRLRGASIL